MTGLTPHKPCFILYNNKPGHNTAWCGVRLVSGMAFNSSITYKMGTSGINCLTIIPESSSISLSLSNASDDNDKLYLYQ